MSNLERDLQKQLSKSMQGAADKVSRTSSGKSVDAIARALEQEFAKIGLSNFDKRQLKEWAQAVKDGTQLRFG